MLRFGLFGIPVTIHWFFWITAALLSGQLLNPDPNAVVLLLSWMGVVFLSIVWHELGHGVMFRKFGGNPRINLHGFGGTCSAEGYYSRKQDILISAAGPAAGLLVGCGLILLIAVGVLKVPQGSLIGSIVSMIIFVNVAWSIVNLFPIYPLDGGHIFQAITGDARKTALVGAIFGFLLAIVGFLALGSIYVALLFGFLGYQNLQRYKGGPTQGFAPFGGER